MDGDQIFKGNEGEALRFLTDAAKNNFQSERHGKPLFDTVLYCEVMTPGHADFPRFEIERQYCQEAGGETVQTEKYAQYRTQVEAFKAQTDTAALNGLPLQQWPQVDAGTAASLRAQNVFTVEGLASLDDVAVQRVGMGGFALREQAKQFLQSRQFGVPSAAAAAELANARVEIQRLTNENAELRATLTSKDALIGSMSSDGNAAPPEQPVGLDITASTVAPVIIPAPVDMFAPAAPPNPLAAPII